MRARLLGFFPETFSESGRDVDGESGWLALLAESGAEDLLTALPDTSGNAASGSTAPSDPYVSPADWLARWEAHRRRNRATSGRSPQTLDLAARMADRLRADDHPVELFQGRWQRTADLDLLDLCLASGVRVAEPDDQDKGTAHSSGVPLVPWLSDTAPGARDLTAVAEQPVFRALLSRSVGGIGDARGQRLGESGLARLAAHPVLSVILQEWLTARAEEYMAARGLPGLRTALNRLLAFRTVVADVAPEAVRLLESHDIVPLLASTLRTGVLDELGWPALDETYAELAAEAATRQQGHRSEGVGVTGAWPALVLNTLERAVVIGPEGVLLRHTLRLPASVDRWRTPAFRYVDGELLVIWWEDGKQLGYWSHRPAEVFTVGGEQTPRWGGSGPSDEVCLPLPDGGRATGGKALHAGDTSLPPQRAVISDGTGHWREGHQGTQRVWLEYDPVGGTHGRASLPAFLRSGVQDGTRLLTEHCQVLPLQPGLETTPFGTDGTVLGRWVRRTATEPGTAAPADGHRTVAGTPDGHTVTLPHPLPDGSPVVPLGALTLPGGSRPVVVLRHRSVEAHPADTDGTGGGLWSVGTGTSGGNDVAGTPYVPPVAYWHALRPRDEQGSTALRNLTDDRAEELIKEVAVVVARHLEAFRAVEEYTGPSAQELSQEVVARVLPEVSDVRLLAGVTALVRSAVDRAVAAVQYLEPPKPAQPATPRNTARTQGMFFDQEPEHGDDTTLRNASAWGSERMHGSWWGSGTRWTVIRQILAVNHVLGGEPAFGPPTPSKVPFTPVDGWQRDEFTVPGESLTWASLLDKLPELAYRAASATTSPSTAPVSSYCWKPSPQARWPTRRAPSGRWSSSSRWAREGPGRAAPRPYTASARCCAREPAPSWSSPTAAGTPGTTRHAGSPWTTTRPEPSAPSPASPWTASTSTGRASPATGSPGSPLWYGRRARHPGVRGRRGLPHGHRNRPPPVRRPAVGSGRGARRRGARAARDEDTRLRDGPSQAGHPAPRRPARPAPGTAAPGPGRAVVHGTRRPGRRRGLARAPGIPRPRPRGTGPRPLGHHGGRRRPDPQRGLPDLAHPRHRCPGRHRPPGPAPSGRTRRGLRGPDRPAHPRLHPAARAPPAGAPARRARGPAQPPRRPAPGAGPRYGLERVGGLDRPGDPRRPRAPRVRRRRRRRSGPGRHGAAPRPGHGNNEKLLIRPAGLAGPDDPAFGLVEGTAGRHGTGDLLALRALLSEETDELVSAGAPDGSPHHPAQDPTRAVPDLVAEAADALGLSTDTAALYLMLLALPDPTDRNCVRWTEWKPARVKKARAELAATGLVVEAKRARAGRALFLPCGWLERGAPGLPLETWKEGLYPVAGSARTLPHLPVPALFAAAWARVRGGDAPAFEELDTRATRKGRRR